MLELYQWLWMFLGWYVAYLGIVTVHECGHYLGGLLIGVPAGEMRIRLFCFPQHVALKDGAEWVSPIETERYVRLAEAYMPRTAKALIFVAGGFVMENLGLLGWVIFKLPFHREVISLALLMTMIYLVADVALFAKTRKASMDFSALYSISPLWGGLLTLAIVGMQWVIFILR